MDMLSLRFALYFKRRRYKPTFLFSTSRINREEVEPKALRSSGFCCSFFQNIRVNPSLDGLAASRHEALCLSARSNGRRCQFGIIALMGKMFCRDILQFWHRRWCLLMRSTLSKV